MIAKKRIYEVIKDFTANVNYKNQVVNYTYKKGRNVKLAELDKDTVRLLKNNLIKELIL